MREFTTYEKKLIKELIKNLKPCIGDFIADNILKNRGILINRSSKIISIICLNNDQKALSDLFDILSLLDYLEKERLIFVHSNPNPLTGNFLSNNWTYNQGVNQLTDEAGNTILNIHRIDIQTSVFDIIVRYISTFYYPNTELKLLVERNFDTIENKQLREALTQTKYSKYALYIALFALIFTIGYSIFFKSKIELNEKQYQELLDSMISHQKN